MSGNSLEVDYMNRFEKIYCGEVSKDQIEEIKAYFSQTSNVEDWKEWYWAAKCLCVYDEEGLDGKQIVDYLNCAFKWGLRYNDNQELYLDAIRTIGVFYSQMGMHEQVMNYLSAIMELDKNCPDWIHHSFVASEIYTDQIEHILKKPKWFISDLMTDNIKTRAVFHKQVNIFKDFLNRGTAFLLKHRGTDADVGSFREVAGQLKLLDSQEWRSFETAAAGGELEDSLLSNFHEQSDDFSKSSRVSITSKESVAISVDSTGDEDDISNEMELLKTRIGELESKLLTASEKLTESMREIELHKNNINLLESQNSEMRERIKAGFESDDLKDRIKKLEQDLLASNDKLSVSESELLSAISDRNEYKNELELLRKSVSNETPAVIVGSIPLNAFGKISGYIFQTTSFLAGWLERNLSSFNNWWEDRVVSNLSYTQRSRVYDEHLTKIAELDLAALLRILNRNWRSLSRFIHMTDKEHETLQTMFDIRNRWAHSNIAQFDMDDVFEFLETIDDFWSFLNVDKNSMKDIRKFAVSLQAYS